MRCTQTSKLQTVSARRSLLSIWIQLNEILWKNLCSNHWNRCFGVYREARHDFHPPNLIIYRGTFKIREMNYNRALDNVCWEQQREIRYDFWSETLSKASWRCISSGFWKRDFSWMGTMLGKNSMLSEWIVGMNHWVRMGRQWELWALMLELRVTVQS